MSILNLQPERVWKHFHSLTQIPRPSKKEAKAVEFLENFGYRDWETTCQLCVYSW